MKRVKKVLLFIVVTAVLLEAGMWLVGFRPYRNDNYKVHAVPDSPFVGHPQLGFALEPGDYQITLNDSLTFYANHQSNGSRKTCFQPQNFDQRVHMYGCSFTYGYGVNDSSTFSSQLQKKIPNHQVTNHGVIGYGTTQSLLQIREENLDSGDIVVLCFSTHHLIRNTMSQEYRSHLKIGFENSSKDLDKQMASASFPYLTKDQEKIQFASWNQLYDHFTFRETLASVNFIQTTYDELQDNKEAQLAVTTELIMDMDEHCRSKNARFVLAILDSDEHTDVLLEQIGDIESIQVGFDFANQKLTNHPYDSHPNHQGHSYIASKLNDLFSSEKPW